MFDGQRIVVSSKTQWAFTSGPVQITEKLRKTALLPAFCSVLSPHDATGRNRDAGGYRFPESDSGIFETQMRKGAVLSSTRRIIFP